MIAQITEKIQSRLTLSGTWAKVYRFVEQITADDGRMVPAEYTSGSNYKAIEFDKYKGVIYTRLNGDIQISESELTSNPCKGSTEFVFPFRSVSIIKKEFSTNGCFADDYFGNKIVSLLNGISLSTVNGIRRTSVKIESIKHGNQTILNDEYSGFETKDFPFQYSYVAVDYSIVIIASLECITDLCEAYA